MIIPIIVLIGVFILIAIRQVGNIRFQIWQIMLLGTIIVLITRQISITNALMSINLDVMMFLFSMFVIGVALEESGYLSFLSYRLFRRAKNINQLLLYVLFGAGLASTFLMNDTLAIIGTPMLLLMARKYAINPKILLLTLSFAVTIGSVMSPLGNPQNFLIATQANLDNSFITFFRYLCIPTLINLFAAFFLIKLFYKKQINHDYQLNHTYESIKDHRLASLAKMSLIILLSLIFIKIILTFLHFQIQIKLVYITVIAAIPILLFSKNRIRIIAKVDWHSLIFFAAMFVLMASVWQSGFFQLVINNLNINLVSIPIILVVSVVLSQLISNVPLVAMYLPLLSHLGASDKEIMVLAAASTIAGNLLILGAASNIIIIHNAEKKASITITFLEFAKIGIPMTLINIFIYWIFLA
ncbi:MULTISPECIES: SLC13 family permease [unclassified Francisella]|uniref:SLC13 family permease n=1 Tax=unclassified Francisella TaxID=2610885 RepID=UPI002E33485A|nr:MULTISPECIES: SLC13 family permease [unclassified Francisella]MED7818722.1 SLC13 family permease [Francisella sp. 19S2-4]MED7829561.1 SLC13 family permease [Francisella sp. 19S2-10]